MFAHIKSFIVFLLKASFLKSDPSVLLAVCIVMYLDQRKIFENVLFEMMFFNEDFLKIILQE